MNTLKLIAKYKNNKEKFINECCYSLSKNKKDIISNNYKIIKSVFNMAEISYTKDSDSSIYTICFTIMSLILNDMNVTEVTNIVDLYFNKVISRISNNENNIFNVQF